MLHQRKTVSLILFLLLSVVLPFVVEAGDYRIGSDDILKINVYRESELERSAKVSADGYITFPLIGKVKVDGYTVLELEQVLNEKLREYLKQPHVTVFIETYSSIAVIGQVESPGSYSLDKAPTVLKAISMAGGFTPIAAPNGVKILRRKNGEEMVIEVNVGDIIQDGEVEKDIPLKRGDTIVVPESFF